MKQLINYIKKNLELLIWFTALIALFLLNPENGSFTLCPFHNLGISFCPGCGIGHSIHYALVFDFKKSLSSHPLGILAVVVIIKRIFTLIKINIKTYEQKIDTTHSRNSG
ncbi:MAG: DUF2752 domain-containing protein [Candidatus Cyclobacteriaceae bacterium M2_1C_046]